MRIFFSTLSIQKSQLWATTNSDVKCRYCGADGVEGSQARWEHRALHAAAAAAVLFSLKLTSNDLLRSLTFTRCIRITVESVRVKSCQLNYKMRLPLLRRTYARRLYGWDPSRRPRPFSKPFRLLGKVVEDPQRWKPVWEAVLIFLVVVFMVRMENIILHIVPSAGSLVL